MKKSVEKIMKSMKKLSKGMAVMSLAGVLSVYGVCAVGAAESVKDLVGTVENPEESVIGKWCVTGGHADETIEFLEDESMILAGGGVETKGVYMQDPTNSCVYYMLEGASDTQNASGILYYKINGDHLALLATEEEMELSIITAYYTREEAVENYDLESDIE